MMAGGQEGKEHPRQDLGPEPVRSPMRLKCWVGRGMSPSEAGSWLSVEIGYLGAVGSYGGLLCEREGMVRFALWK